MEAYITNSPLCLSAWPKIPTANFLLRSTTNIPEVLDIRFGYSVKQFTDNTKLAGAVNSLVGQDALEDLDTLEYCSITNGMKLNKSKCWILRFGWSTYDTTINCGSGWRGVAGEQKGMWALGDNRVHVSQQCPAARRAKPILGSPNPASPAGQKRWLPCCVQSGCNLTFSPRWSSGPHHLGGCEGT